MPWLKRPGLYAVAETSRGTCRGQNVQGYMVVADTSVAKTSVYLTIPYKYQL